jgi:hypothetical protein
MLERKQFRQLVEQVDETLFDIVDDVLENFLVDEPVDEFEVFDGQSDDFGIVFQGEDHFTDEFSQKTLDIYILVMKVIVNVNLELLKVVATLFNHRLLD